MAVRLPSDGISNDIETPSSGLSSAYMASSSALPEPDLRQAGTSSRADGASMGVREPVGDARASR